MLAAGDITGVCAMIPTPCKEDAGGWDAIRAGDAPRVDAIAEDISSVPSVMPPGQAEHFAEYNVQAEKARFNASGYVRCGPTRAPYTDLPPQWAERAEAHGKGWAAVRARYAKPDRNGH